MIDRRRVHVKASTKPLCSRCGRRAGARRVRDYRGRALPARLKHTLLHAPAHGRVHGLIGGPGWRTGVRLAGGVLGPVEGPARFREDLTVSKQNGKAALTKSSVPPAPRGRMTKCMRLALAKQSRRDSARHTLSRELAVWAMALRTDTAQMLKEVCKMLLACQDEQNLLFELFDAGSLEVLREVKRDLEDADTTLLSLCVKCPRPDVHGSEAAYRKSYDL